MNHIATPLALLAGLLLIGTVNAQDGAPSCGTRDVALMERVTGNAPELLAQIAQSEAELETFTSAFIASGQADGERSVYTIPVVFHIIHEFGTENIPDANVHDAMRILNEDFNKENPDWDQVRPEFLDLVADVELAFVLARKDPDGNCTNGITRTVSHLTNEGESAMKALIQWPRNKYLNVWVCANAGGAGVAGYTMTPGTAHWLASQDGIVMRFNYVGSLPPASPGNSRTLTHEVGHWINLEHTWGPSNNPGQASNCNSDDGVADTPNTIGWTSCDLDGNTCGGGIDNVENYMEYAFCDKMFTHGQKDRMTAALNSSTAQRNQLWTPANLAATGVDGPGVLCVAQFQPGPQSICAGNSVQFTDQSYHGVTSRTWSFPGGTPDASTASSPVVIYDTPGTYAVTLTVSDGSGQVTSTSEGHVQVLPATGGTVPFTEGFEEYPDLDGSDWTILNQNANNTFEMTDAAAFSGTKSMRIVNHGGMTGQVDVAVSGTYNMEGVEAIVIGYSYAYAQRIASSNDRLRVYVSNDCGQTWTLRQQLTGMNTLNTVGAPVTSSFVPGGDQWGSTEITNISAPYHVSDFRFKFEFESDGGNNLYIDHINLNGGDVGLFEWTRQGAGFVVQPNPANGSAEVVVDLATGGMTELLVHDPAGRQVTAVYHGALPTGTHRIPLAVDHLASGLYLLTLRVDGHPETIRFVVD